MNQNDDQKAELTLLEDTLEARSLYDNDRRSAKLKHKLENQKPAECETEAEVAPDIATYREPSPPHPLLQKLGSVSKQYASIVDGSMKAVFEQYFVENQTMKASAKFLEPIKGGRKKDTIRKCFTLILNS